MELPRIERVDGQHRLIVDGRPFLILGLQWGCDSCFSREEMNPLFPHAAKMAANTATLPTYWREIEPEPGRFEFGMVDERIRQCRANGLRAILLWFATWKNACAVYAPDYIRDDPKTYPLAIDRNGQPTISHCPNSDITWERDRGALDALMTRLRDIDEVRTVISVQVENEPGIIGSDRCYCSVCNERFAAEGFEQTWGKDAPEAFSTISVARYIDRLAAAAKAIHPLPIHTNVWLARGVGAIPGISYPSGGAVAPVLGLFCEHSPNLDFISPDIYMCGYRDFNKICCDYLRENNPLYIAEAGSGPEARAERNVFYAIGDHGAIGFDPWAIDEDPLKYGTPLVDPIDGTWGQQAYWLRDSYVAISRAIEPIVEAQGTNRLFTFVQEPAEQIASWAADGCDVLISYHHREGRGRGMVIQLGPNEFLALGVDFDARFRRPRPDGSPRHILSSDWGTFEKDRWVTLHPMRRERPESAGLQVEFLEPGVAKVVLVAD